MPIDCTSIGQNANIVTGFVSPFVGSSLVAILAAWLSAMWSLKRFRSEKWWELRSDHYKRLLENLAIIKHCVERDLRYRQHPDVMVGANEVLEERLPQAMAEVELIAAMGPLYISETASAALVQFSKNYCIDLGEGVNGDIPRLLEAANQCLKVVREEATHIKKS